MIVVVDGASGTLWLEDADNVAALCVRLDLCSGTDAPDVVGDLGHIEGDHAWLSIAGLRALSQRAEDPLWCEQFDGAMAYARGKGWTDDTGLLVRAHLT